MALTSKLTQSLMDRGFSRRDIGRISMGAAAAMPFFSEFALAQQAEQKTAAARRGGGGMGGARGAYDRMVRHSNKTRWVPARKGSGII